MEKAMECQTVVWHTARNITRRRAAFSHAQAPQKDAAECQTVDLP